jgi:S1-C subfamily serine protease
MLRVTRNFERSHWGDCARFAVADILQTDAPLNPGNSGACWWTIPVGSSA